MVYLKVNGLAERVHTRIRARGIDGLYVAFKELMKGFFELSSDRSFAGLKLKTAEISPVVSEGYLDVAHRVLLYLSQRRLNARSDLDLRTKLIKEELQRAHGRHQLHVIHIAQMADPEDLALKIALPRR